MFYRPVLELTLQGWQSVTAIVILDGGTPHLPVGAGVVFGDRWQIFLLSLAHGGRAIRLVRVMLPGKGLTQKEKLEALLTRAAMFLNMRVKRALFLADAGFRDCDWAHMSCLWVGKGIGLGEGELPDELLTRKHRRCWPRHMDRSG